jgi:hypothetical protein
MNEFNQKNLHKLILPPWKLKGSGLILFYKLPKSLLAAHLKKIDAQYLGGVSFFMLINYESSPVGPYQELLFIPGRFRIGKISGYHITYIRVSTEISTVNGIHNWAIPKQTINFAHKKETNTVSWKTDNGVESFSGTFGYNSISIPVFTHFIPYQLIQQNEHILFTIRPLASGFASLASVKSMEINIPELEFLSGADPLFSCYVSRFNMSFPLAKTRVK